MPLYKYDFIQENDKLTAVLPLTRSMSFYWSLLKPEALVIALYIEAVGMEACYSVVHGSVKSSSNTCILCLMLLIYLTCIRLVASVCHAMFMKTHFVSPKVQRKTTFFSIFLFFIFYSGTILNSHELAMQHMSDILHYNKNCRYNYGSVTFSLYKVCKYM